MYSLLLNTGSVYLHILNTLKSCHQNNGRIFPFDVGVLIVFHVADTEVYVTWAHSDGGQGAVQAFMIQQC